MEVSTALVAMDTDMDMDIDIDLGPDFTDPMQVGYAPVPSSEVPSENAQSSQLLSNITAEQSVPHKVHIRGLDDLTTNDIRTFSMENYSAHPPSRIEWVDDTSANIVYGAPSTAEEALASFSLQSDGDIALLHPLQLRAAKPLSTHPGSDLKVRIAVTTDQKRPKAYESSRFYLMHPEHDPRERRMRGSRAGDEYRRKRYGNEEHRRRRNIDVAEGFTASMYDDDADAVAGRCGTSSRRNSRSSLSSGTGSGGRVGSYRPKNNHHPRSRDRSASPDRDGRDRHVRKRTPPPRYESRDPYPFPQANRNKELFPAKAATVDVGHQIRGISANSKELFPNKKAATNLKKELFPLKAGISIHRRSDAFDAADETADLFANGMTVPFVDGAVDQSTNNGRLRPTDPDPIAEDLENLERGGFSIKGASKQVDKGFSIRGTANGVSSGSAVKELFPVKVGNAGKELFAERLHGRGGKRNRAEDMFY
ncbi:hypothetical protein MMC26_003085 [Xylographa opegraphella]|nr:hypothetical protein [Xylographa opegraphella]